MHLGGFQLFVTINSAVINIFSSELALIDADTPRGPYRDSIAPYRDIVVPCRDSILSQPFQYIAF